MINQANTQEYDVLLQIWERAVRSSHHFLSEEDIRFYKPLVRHEYFPAVQLYTIRNHSGQITAFMGLSDSLIEMLFVDPDEQGHGYGKQLIEFAIRQKQIHKVDVNEQNGQALRFYQNRGFEIISRDDLDSMGKPFPILHMQLKNIRLRKAEPEDIPTMHTAFEQSVLNTCSQHYTAPQIRAWIERATLARWRELLQSDLHFILAEETKHFRTVGFTSINANGYLHSMFVHPQFQHQGIASLLLCQAEEYARLHQAVSIHSEVSITARPFFEKQGYITEKEQIVSIGDVKMTNFVMYKYLS